MSTQRKIKIKNQEFKDLIDKKYQLLKEGKANAKEAEKLRQRNQEIEKELKPVKDKLLEKMENEEKNIDLGEYERTLTTEKTKGKYYIVIEDALESFKEQFKKQKQQEYEQSNQQQSNQQGSDKADTTK